MMGFASTALLGTVGFVACTGPDNGNGGPPTHTAPSISAPGESTNPFMTPSPSLSPSPSTSQEPVGSQFISVCDTQLGTQEGQLPGGVQTLSATSTRPSVFVVSPDRSTQQSFRVRSENDQQWNTITHNRSVGIVGLATADTVFDSTQGRSVWAKTCEASAAAGRDEVASRVRDLCRRPELRLTEVVVYQLGENGRPALQGTARC